MDTERRSQNELGEKGMAAANTGWVKGEILNRPNGLYKLKVETKENLKLGDIGRIKGKSKVLEEKMSSYRVSSVYSLLGHLKFSKKLPDCFKISRHLVWHESNFNCTNNVLNWL